MRHTALSLGLVLLASQAQAHLAPYVSFGAGAVFPGQDIEIDKNSSYVLYGPSASPSGVSIFQLSDIDWKNDLQTGFETNLIVGIHLPHQLRLEGEFIYQNIERDMSGTYTWNEFDALTGAQIFKPAQNILNNSSSTVNVFGLMSNLAYDFKNGSPWTPFVVGGFGIAWINSDSSTEYGTLYSDPFGAAIPTPADQTSPELYGTAFAWQFKAGVNYAIDHHMSMDVVYRLFGTTEFEQHNGSIVTNSSLADARGDFLIPQGDTNGLMNNSVFVNFRYTFK